ncbi:hypothetical protein FQZ97_976810 [compost metagenome]
MIDGSQQLELIIDSVEVVRHQIKVGVYVAFAAQTFDGLLELGHRGCSIPHLVQQADISFLCQKYVAVGRGVCKQSFVSTRSTGFLVEGFHGPGNAIVNGISNVPFVDPHAKGFGCGQQAVPVGLEVVLHLSLVSIECVAPHASA